MGDDLIQEAIGKGNIDVSMTIGENTLPKVFNNVLHVPRIVKNLFFMSKVTSIGHIFQFKNNECIIKNIHKEVVGHGTRDNQLYKLHCNTKLIKKECVQVVDLGESDTKLSAKKCVQIIVGCIESSIFTYGMTNQGILMWKKWNYLHDKTLQKACR